MELDFRMALLILRAGVPHLSVRLKWRTSIVGSRYRLQSLETKKLSTFLFFNTANLCSLSIPYIKRRLNELKSFKCQYAYSSLHCKVSHASESAMTHSGQSAITHGSSSRVPPLWFEMGKGARYLSYLKQHLEAVRYRSRGVSLAQMAFRFPARLI